MYYVDVLQFCFFVLATPHFMIHTTSHTTSHTKSHTNLFMEYVVQLPFLNIKAPQFLFLV